MTVVVTLSGVGYALTERGAASASEPKAHRSLPNRKRLGKILGCIATLVLVTALTLAGLQVGWPLLPFGLIGVMVAGRIHSG